MSVGLWVNVEKSQLNKNFHLPAMGVHCDLPKALARQAVAIRFTRVAHDMFTAKAPFDYSKEVITSANPVDLEGLQSSHRLRERERES